MAQRKYFVQNVGGSPEGPFTKKDIAEDLARGRLSYDVTVCLEGETRWHRLEKISTLASLVPRRSMWLMSSVVLCGAGVAGNLALALVPLLALGDRWTDSHIAGAVVCLVVAAIWGRAALGLYQRRYVVRRWAIRWMGLCIVLHIAHVLLWGWQGVIPLPFEILALVTTVLSSKDFSSALT